MSFSTRNFATSAFVSLLRGAAGFVLDGPASELSAFAPSERRFLEFWEDFRKPRFDFGDFAFFKMGCPGPVSYTHLTLPKIYPV